MVRGNVLENIKENLKEETVRRFKFEEMKNTIKDETSVVESLLFGSLTSCQNHHKQCVQCAV